MSALLTIRHGQDWHDGLIMLAVAGGLVALALADLTVAKVAVWRDTGATRDAIRDHAHGGTDRPAAYVPVHAIEVDHQPCTGDGCANTICFCRQTTTCPGAVDVGCLHLTWVGALCGACRGECSECRFEDDAERALAIVRDGLAS